MTRRARRPDAARRRAAGGRRRRCAWVAAVRALVRRAARLAPGAGSARSRRPSWRLAAGRRWAAWLWARRRARAPRRPRAGRRGSWLAAGAGRPLPPAPGLAGRRRRTSPPDGALSGIVALHVRDGVERLVFVPHVPYSGSLKSHLTAPLAAGHGPRARVRAGLGPLLCAVRGRRCSASRARPRRRAALDGLAAGLYVAFAPAFVTRYSLSNDGNYVEVLALGTLGPGRWRVRWARRDGRAACLAVVIGAAAGPGVLVPHPGGHPRGGAGASFLLGAPTRARRSLGARRPALGLRARAACPALLWNAANGWESFAYLLPGGTPVGEAAAEPRLPARLADCSATTCRCCSATTRAIRAADRPGRCWPCSRRWPCWRRGRGPPRAAPARGARTPRCGCCSCSRP